MGPQRLVAPTFVSVFVLQTLEFTTIELPPVCFNLARHSRSRSVKNDIVTETLAEIWVDGNYMGQVGDYTPSSQPLGLAAGRHHIELREPGYDVSSFDVDVIPGQVIPFQGTLQ